MKNKKLKVRIVVLGNDKKIRKSLKKLGINFPNGKWAIDTLMTDDKAFELSKKINNKLDAYSQCIDKCEMDWQTVIQISSHGWLDEWDRKLDSGEAKVDDLLKEMDASNEVD